MVIRDIMAIKDMLAIMISWVIVSVGESCNRDEARRNLPLKIQGSPAERLPTKHNKKRFIK